ncbi:MAG TPA: PEGA domain-containing protein [Kofleriaceae bacterium]|nr:PEGA domain-containing protein [Kofleriaceae bacterium]
MRTWLVCMGVACAGVAAAGPEAGLDQQYQQAARLDDSGEHEKALELVNQGLASAPNDLRLLGLKGAVLIKLRDYVGALAAHQAYLAAGATGANRREAQRIVDSLLAVKSTFLEITLANGPADVYLDSKTYGVLCRMERSCQKPVLPGEYKVIAERPGFERWSTRVTVDKDMTAKVAIKLIEQPSQLTVRTTPPGARVKVDGAPYTAPTSLPPGKHRVVVTLAGHAAVRREVTAREGKAIELDVTLMPRVSIQVEPPGAELLLDGNPIAIEDGLIEIPAGAHVLFVSAKGYRSDRIEVPAARGPDYQLAIELQPGRLTPQRKLALAVGGAALISVGAGVVFGLNGGQFRTFESQLGYDVGGFALAVAIGLWLGDVPRAQPAPRVTVTPRVDSVTGLGLGLAVTF